MVKKRLPNGLETGENDLSLTDQENIAAQAIEKKLVTAVGPVSQVHSGRSCGGHGICQKQVCQKMGS